jgi:hypothetical protein
MTHAPDRLPQKLFPQYLHLATLAGSDDDEGGGIKKCDA